MFFFFFFKLFQDFVNNSSLKKLSEGSKNVNVIMIEW